MRTTIRGRILWPSCVGLAQALEAGRAFTIAVAGERLHVPAEARFNLEHERERGREELESQLPWRRAPRQKANGKRQK